MKKMMKNLLVALALVGFICLPAISSEAKNVNQNIKVTVGDLDFTLINRTGVEINALYVTPHNANEWGEDILGADTLLNNETLDISFSRKERAKLWDLRVEDEDGAFIEWDSLNLLEISKVTLFYKNGKATAIVE